MGCVSFCSAPNKRVEALPEGINPSDRNQRFRPPPFTQGRLFRAPRAYCMAGWPTQSREKGAKTPRGRPESPRITVRRGCMKESQLNRKETGQRPLVQVGLPSDNVLGSRHPRAPRAYCMAGRPTQSREKGSKTPRRMGLSPRVPPAGSPDSGAWHPHSRSAGCPPPGRSRWGPACRPVHPSPARWSARPRPHTAAR